jgi:hypothetical protein
MDENSDEIRADSARIQVGIILSIANGPRSAKEIKEFVDSKYEKFQKEGEKASWTITSIYANLSLMEKRKWVKTKSISIQVDYKFRSANEEVRKKRTRAKVWELGAQRDEIETFASIFKFVWENGKYSVRELMTSRWYIASTHYTDFICDSMYNRGLLARWSKREEFTKDIRNTGWKEHGKFYEEGDLKVQDPTKMRIEKLGVLEGNLKRRDRDNEKDNIETLAEFRLIKILEYGPNWHRKGTLFPLLLGLYFSTSKRTFIWLLGNLVQLVPESAHFFYSIFADITLNEITVEARHKVYKDMLGNEYKGDETDSIGEKSLDPRVYLPRALFDYMKKMNYLRTIPSGLVENTVNDDEKEYNYSAGIPEYFLDYRFLPAILICYLMGSTEYPDSLTGEDTLYAGPINFMFNTMKPEFKTVESEVKEILMQDKP